jgi:hypothetical protein
MGLDAFNRGAQMRILSKYLNLKGVGASRLDDMFVLTIPSPCAFFRLRRP